MLSRDNPGVSAIMSVRFESQRPNNHCVGQDLRYSMILVRSIRAVRVPATNLSLQVATQDVLRIRVRLVRAGVIYWCIQ